MNITCYFVQLFLWKHKRIGTLEEFYDTPSSSNYIHKHFMENIYLICKNIAYYIVLITQALPCVQRALKVFYR